MDGLMPVIRWRHPGLWLLVLWLAAVLLAVNGLGNVPLRDWDEAIVARVSLEISRHAWPDVLLPTYLDQAYLNKPPGLHMLVAALIRLWQHASGAGDLALPPEGVVRLLPALGSTLIVPLLGLVQWRLRPGNRGAALATAVITLTLLPLARHGRLAMLDGTQLSAMAVVWLGLLLAQPGRRPALSGGLIAGLGGSALLLLKAPVALPVLAITLLLRALDRVLDRRGWILVLAGMMVGLLPGLGWHGWHLLQRGSEALLMWGPQGIARLTTTLDGHDGGPGVPVLQLLIGGWPWLPLWPFGLALAWRERSSSAGRWVLGLTLATALMVFPLRTQLPWYSLVLWPAFSLCCGPALANLVEQGAPGRVAWRGIGVIAWIWLGLGGLLFSVVAVSATPLVPAAPELADLRLLPVPAAIGLVIAGHRFTRAGRRLQRLGALLVLALGWYASLFLLFSSSEWNWELNEQPRIDPQMLMTIPRNTHQGDPLPIALVSGDDARERPSLIWYLNQKFLPLQAPEDTALIRNFQLISRSDNGILHGPAACQLEVVATSGWKRWRCSQS